MVLIFISVLNLIIFNIMFKFIHLKQIKENFINHYSIYLS